MTAQPPVRCDDPSTWRHRDQRIDLPRLLQLIEQNGGPEDLDLHGCDMSGIDARPEALRPHTEAYAHKHGADARPPWLAGPGEPGISLMGAHLEHSDLARAELEHAILTFAFLRNSDLRSANLENAYFARAHLQSADLGFTRLSGNRFWEAHLDGAIWSECSLHRTPLRRDQLGRAIGDELAAKGQPGTHRPGVLWTFHAAREVYLVLKTNFDSIGRYDDASWAYVKEQQMEKAMYFPTSAGHRWIRRQLRRGARRWRKKSPARLRRLVRSSIFARLRWAWLHLLLFVGLRPADFKRALAELAEQEAEEERIDRPRWLRNWFYEATCGYGENPWRPVTWAAVVVLLFALIYAAAGNIASGDVGALQGQPTHSPITTLVHSISAFATIGFNTLEPQGWGARLLTAIEAMFGIGLFALFVFTLGNRMRRS